MDLVNITAFIKPSVHTRVSRARLSSLSLSLYTTLA